MQSFGQWLKQRRKALDLTQDELALRISCSGETIRKIEADTRRPSKQIAELLADELEIAPESRPAFIQFARSGASANVPTFRPLPGPNFAPFSLPVPPTRLIGREQDIAAIHAHLKQEDVRLLTLLGPPGVGKTRLCLQIGSDLLSHAKNRGYSDGVFFIALASTNQPEMVPSVTAQALGVKETASEPVRARLLDYLRDKRALLLFDNFEQVTDAGPFIGELLAYSPRLTVLITSRAPLDIRGEWQYPVAPLSFPDLKSSPHVDSLVTYPAVSLFLERARAVRPDFRLNQSNAKAVSALCARLDGLPLAIELIAARTKLLSPEALLERLGGHLMLTSDGRRDLPPRHRTLHKAIQWSYDLLDASEQLLLARLAVFVGGATLDAVEKICADEQDPETSLLDCITSLLNKNLVKRERRSGEAIRLSMLEMIREFARERLLEQGAQEVRALRSRHADYYLELTEAAEPEIRSGTEQDKWLNQLDRDYENVRAAVRWCIEERNVEKGLRFGAGLWQFWHLRGYWSEGRSQLTKLLELTENAEPQGRQNQAQAALRARVLMGTGVLATFQNEYDVAQVFQGGSVAIWRELVTPKPRDEAGASRKDAVKQTHRREYEWGLAYALARLGFTFQRQGNFEAARALYEESWTLWKQLDDRWGLAWSTSNLGRVSIQQGDLETARKWFEEALQLWRVQGNQDGIGAMQTNLGEVARGQGDYARATEYYEASLSSARHLGKRSSIAILVNNLGLVASAQGDAVRARQLLMSSLELYREMGNKHGMIVALGGLGGVLKMEGQVERSVEIFAAVTAYSETNSIRMEYLDYADFARNVAAARDRLDAAVFDRAWTAGSGLSLEEAVRRALG